MKYQIASIKILLLLVLVMGGGVLLKPAVAQASGEIKFEVREGTEAAEGTKVKYDLPWPGILPDHSLYRIKMIRDRIWGFLIRDPLKKSQWSLLMADKRILSVAMLMEKGKADLAVSTATKAEKYLEEAVNQAYLAEKMGKGDRAFFQKIITASLKHTEILKAILEKAPEELRPVVEKAMGYPKDAKEKILMLLEEKP